MKNKFVKSIAALMTVTLTAAPIIAQADTAKAVVVFAEGNSSKEDIIPGEETLRLAVASLNYYGNICGYSYYQNCPMFF